MMKGTLLVEAFLSLRGGDDSPGAAAVVDVVESARGRRLNGAGIVELKDRLLDHWAVEKPRTADANEAESFRSMGCGASCNTLSGELRIASAITSIRGGLETSSTWPSYSPYKGRGGRSGVVLPLAELVMEANRCRASLIIRLPSAPTVRCWFTAGTRSGDLGVAYICMIDSLMLRCVACRFGEAGVESGKLVASSPNLFWPGDGG
jgi:hypothetical protein